MTVALALGAAAMAVTQAPAATQITNEAAIQAIQAGQAAAQRQDWTGALAQFERAATNTELAPAARFYIGLVREQTGRQGEAVAIYKEVMGMRGVPGDVWSAAVDRLTGIGFERLQKQDVAGAEAALESAAKAARFDVLHYYSLALGAQQKWSELEKIAHALLRINPAGLEAWRFLHEAQAKQAEIAAADPARAAEAAKLQEKVTGTVGRLNDLPVLLADVALGQENGTHVVTATMMGAAAPAGSWCIIGFSLDMAQANWRAPIMVTAPAMGERAEIKARPATTSQTQRPPASERVRNVTYPAPYCEEKGAAAATPPEARKAKLDGCPETESEARRLLVGRKELGRHHEGSGDSDIAYPAGGITLFGTPINRLTVRGDLYYFGLPGSFADHQRKFSRAYGKDCANDGVQNYCQAGKDRNYGHLAFATLTKPDWPERMHPQQIYLQCLYW